MVDIYLQELMSGHILPKNKVKKVEATPKDKFDIIIDKEVEKLVSEYKAELLFNTSQLEPINLKIEKKKKQILEEIKNSAYLDQMERAISLLLSETEDIEKDKIETIKKDLFRAKEIIDTMDLNVEVDRDLKSTLNISDETIKYIFDLAVIKYDKNQIESALILLILISTLTDDSDYWYRAGIAAQSCNQQELALKFYTQAMEDNPELVGAKIFSIECHIKLGFKTEALELYNEFKRDSSSQNLDEKWQGSIESIDFFLAA
jgi:tetratricopeptide (TPR) repeat protein